MNASEIFIQFVYYSSNKKWKYLLLRFVRFNKQRNCTRRNDVRTGVLEGQTAGQK